MIATQKEIRDDAALLFTEGFYDALFNGETYENAYELGCNRIHLELYKGKGSERKLVPVFEEEERKFVNLEQHEILLFFQKDSPNLIFQDVLLTCFQADPSNLQQPPVIVTTMRADFLGEALKYRPLADILNSDVQLVGAMNRQELSQVIVNPAAMLGVEFEPGLVDRILDDVENQPGNLALLEFALTELWKEQKDNQLTHNGYENIGRVEGALAKYAEKKYQELSEEEKDQARQIFIQLVRLGDNNNNTRRVVDRNQITEENWNLITRKHGLADSRLVVTGRDSDEHETLEIVHEALIRHWDRIPQWLGESQELLIQQRKIENEAKQWSDSGKNIGYLLQKKRLREAKEFQKQHQEKYPLSKLATDFIAESNKYQRKESLKSLSLFLIVPLIGAVFLIRNEIGLNTDRETVQKCGQKEKCKNEKIEALERLVAAKRSLQPFQLKGANLEGANLEGANLLGADLEGTKFQGADLENADLEGANLKDADLNYADLSAARLHGANLSGARLRDADLYDAKLEAANLIGANLYNAKLRGTNLSDADLTNANLNGAYLNGAFLFGATLENAKLRNVKLSFAELEGVLKLTPSQIKSSCYWEEAVYKGQWNEQTQSVRAIEPDNTNYIQELKQDTSSDPEEQPDCSIWE